MTSLAFRVEPVRQLERTRTRCFVAMMLAACLGGALAGLDQAWQLAVIPFLPAYVGWIVCDLRARRVTLVPAGLLFLASLFPAWGLLAYLLLTRRLVGLLQWVAFCAAMWFPAVLAGISTRAIHAIVHGTHW